MATSERIENLKLYVKGWEEMRADAAERRNRALFLKSLGVQAGDQHGVDYLQKQADEADALALACGQNVIRMAALLARAESGEDV